MRRKQGMSGDRQVLKGIYSSERDTLVESEGASRSILVWKSNGHGLCWWGITCLR